MHIDECCLNILFDEHMTLEWPRLSFGTNLGFIRIERDQVQVDGRRATIADSHESSNHWAKQVDPLAGGIAEVLVDRFLEARYKDRKTLELLCFRVMRGIAEQFDKAFSHGAHTGVAVRCIKPETVAMQLQDAYQLELDPVRYRQAFQAEAGTSFHYRSA